MSDKKRVCIALAAVAAVCLAGLAGVHFALQALFGPTPEYRKGAVWQELKLKWYIQTHSQVALGEVLTFEWEEAYVDRRPYGTGESVRQLTGYEFEVEELNDESWNRLLFFKDGQLVKELIYSWFEWKFPVELLGFTPQTVFELQQDAPQYFFTVAEGYARPYAQEVDANENKKVSFGAAGAFFGNGKPGADRGCSPVPFVSGAECQRQAGGPAGAPGRICAAAQPGEAGPCADV